MNFKPHISRSNRVVCSIPCGCSLDAQFAFAVNSGKLIQLVDRSLERSLQFRLVINFEHDLPRWSRQDRTVDSERELTTEGSCEVISNIKSLLLCELLHLASEFRLDGPQKSKQVI